MKQKEAQARIMSTNQLECIFDTFPEGVIACDDEDKILRINAAALKLFEVPSESLYRGVPYQQFLHAYEVNDQQQRAISLEPWLMSLILGGQATTQQEKPIVLQVPSGRKIYVSIRCFPVLDAQRCGIGMLLYVLYDITNRYQQALHFQRVHQAVSDLKEAIARLPESIDFTFPEGIFLLSPPIPFVAQQIVDVIANVLEFQHVSILAFGPHTGHMHYVMGSGFTSEQEGYRRKISGCFMLSDLVDEATLARLSANQEVILSSDRLRLPPEYWTNFGIEKLLSIPLFLEHQLVGALVIARAGLESRYMPEEIELAKAVATEAMLVIECLRSLYGQTEAPYKVQAHEEIHRLVNDFLNLASHELNTPLTAIKGNIQLAQRRLATLKHQLGEQPEYLRKKIEGVMSPLASAASSARLQERAIKELIDDARIQTNTFELHLQPADLLMLLREVVANQQRLTPERTIVLDLRIAEQVVPVNVDAERITQVIHGYLANALNYSPVDQPVTVQLTVEHGLARVAVHDEGPGIPLEEQERIWERFYFARKDTVQREHDLSIGLGLYLCKVFIERHHGSVGVQSDPGHGATFWFTLPIEGSAAG